MNVLFIILVLTWCVRIFANILSYINLWFVKEYRFDRMFIYLKTPQGKRILFIPFRRPPLSPKTITLFLLSNVGLSFFFFFMPLPILFRLLIIDVCTFPAISLFVLILKIPTLFYHETLIVLAVRKLRRHAQMKVVGITGSFGKTSTKQFLSTILSTKFNVLSTEGSKNSPIAIAETILKNLRPEHEVFIVEMGAYKQGEIAQMTRMVQPQIGIITAINAQHQDLFGTIEMTMKAKYELIEGLTGKKIAIFNKDNTYTREMIGWAKRDHREVWEYSVDDATRTQKDVRNIITATDIEATLNGSTFRISFGDKREYVSVSVVGEHQISNILAAVAGAVVTGMTFSDAVRAVSNIRPVPKVMEVHKGINGSIFINDTYNNNPDSARAALKVLHKTKGKKHLVFQPMVELGSYADSSHEEVGKSAGEVCDEIILTNPNFYTAFQKGVHSINASMEVRIMSAQDATKALHVSIQKGDTTLFKGKEAEAVYQRLIHQLIH